MTDALLIFAKNPALGKTKTRIGHKLGDEIALAIYYKLLNKAQQVTRNLKLDKFVYYSDFVDSEDTWDNAIYQKRRQHPKDLGTRMALAIKEALDSGAQKVVLIGTDIYSLTEQIIMDAFEKLDSHDVVIGPAEDGGYYLIGMKSVNPTIFNLKQWSTSTVFKETIDLIEAQHMSWVSLPTLNDIDEPEDLAGTDLEALIPKQIK